jgi:uncharacterized protein (DUF1778 family)
MLNMLEREVLTEAASLAGLPRSAFLREALREAAEKIVAAEPSP